MGRRIWLPTPPTDRASLQCETGVVDSELYFLFLLKKIEEKNGNVTNAIIEAINEMVAAGEDGGINFVLSDGLRLWAFRRGQLTSHTLYYIYDPVEGYAAAASQYPSASQGSWVAMANYEMAMLTATDEPVVIDVTDYPGDLLVDTDFNNSLDSLDLRDNTEGQDWYESREDVPDLLTIDVTDVGGNSTPKAKLTAALQEPPQNAYLTQEFATAQSSMFWAEADIYVEEITNLPDNPDRTAFMLIGDDTDPTRIGPNSDDPERFVYLAFLKSGGGSTGTMDLVARDRDDAWDAFTTVAAGLSMSEWHTIRVILDLVAGTYDVYVDDTYQATVTSRNEKMSVTHMSFGEWDDGSGTYYVDNVRAVNEAPEPGPFIRDTDFELNVSDEDLRDENPPGEYWYESRGQEPGLLTLNEDDIGGNATKKAAVAASITGNPYLSQQFGRPPTEVFTVQWSIYVESILDISGAPDRTGWMLIGDSSNATRPGPNSDDSERFVYLGFFRDGGGTSGTMDLVARDRDDGWTAFTTVASGLNIGQWYTIKVVCDLASDDYAVYVDGAYQGTVTSRYPKNTVSHISFAQWNDGAGSFYVDDVVEIPGTTDPPEPTFVSLVPDSGASGVGEPRILSVTVADGDGAEDIRFDRIEIRDASGSGTDDDTVFLEYWGESGKVNIYVHGDRYRGGRPGDPVIVEDTLATLDVSQTTVVADGNQLTVNWYIIPKAAFAGDKRIWLFVRDFDDNLINDLEIGTWTVSPPCEGDIDGDGDRDEDDLALFADAFGTESGDAGYEPLADLDGDGDVDGSDVGAMASVFGIPCP